jgi:hypothetical protein
VTSDHGPDPGAMDGRAIAQKLNELSHDPTVSEAMIWIWVGIASARLLEYQRRLEDAGLLP